MKLMSTPAIRVSEADAANDFPSLLARVRAGAEVVIGRNAETVAVLRPAAPNLGLLSESLRLAQERGSDTTLDDEFGRDLDTVVSRICGKRLSTAAGIKLWRGEFPLEFDVDGASLRAPGTDLTNSGFL